MDAQISKMISELELIVKEQKKYLQDEEVEIAVNYALEGDLNKSRDILEKRIKLNPGHDVLDLLARVEAQSGNLQQAEEYWKQALSYQKNCPDCIAGLARIHTIKKQSVRKRPLETIGFFLLILFVILMIGIMVLLNTQNKKISGFTNGITAIQTDLDMLQMTVPSNDEISVDDILNAVQPLQEQFAGEFKKIESQIETLQDNTNENTMLIKNLKTPSQPNIISVDYFKGWGDSLTIDQDSEGKISIIFPEPVFLYEGILSEYGRENLILIADHLTDLIPGSYQITIIGYTDNIEDKDRLSIDRAKTAVQILSEYSRIPMESFRIQPAGSLKAPYPNDTLENQYKNRTVMIIISFLE
ncbi:MAG: hypothetical protein CL609_15065 [Anaerolineaceae bacterium]|nr:hypothetical protein [Anaerolineaceae bacterium]